MDPYPAKCSGSGWIRIRNAGRNGINWKEEGEWGNPKRKREGRISKERKNDGGEKKEKIKNE